MTIFKTSKPILILIIIHVCIVPSLNFSYKLAIDTLSSDSIVSSYNTNLGDCSCDVHAGTCDLFCCCDTSCSTVFFYYI